jgi:hypothetical protein
MKPHFRSATWTIPLYYAVAAAVAGFLFPRIELGLFPRLSSDMTVGSATAIYSSVASGMLALTGVVFSLAFLMIQFSATAYSPRLVTFAHADKIREMARRGEASGDLERKQALEHAIEVGRGGMYLRLTPGQYAALRRA